MFEARRGRVVEFIEEYHDGCWNLQSADGIGQVQRIAENVLVYNRIQNTPSNIALYSAAVNECVKLGQLTWRTGYGSDTMSLMICTREFVEGLSE